MYMHVLSEDVTCIREDATCVYMYLLEVAKEQVCMSVVCASINYRDQCAATTAVYTLIPVLILHWNQ